MYSRQTPLALISFGALLFNAFFWNEQIALNTLLFDLFFISSLFYLYPSAKEKKISWWLLCAHLLAGTALIVFHTDTSKIAFLITLLLLVAFAEYNHRSAWWAAGSVILGFAGFILRFFKLLHLRNSSPQKKRGIGKFIRLAIIPLFILGCFVIVYSTANAVFAAMLGTIGKYLSDFFSRLFSIFSFERMLFLGWGFYCTGALVLRIASNQYERRDIASTDSLIRIRKKRMDVYHSLGYDITVGIMGKIAKGPLALKTEYRTGCLSLLLLNVLLFIVNCIDVNYLWINFTYTPSVNLYLMVHEGTELLIVSIVLAMIVLLVFFRGNLNFYRQNKWLKWGAYAWLLQNAILVVSVLLRDYYYIREFGLAYKRIGVLFFLLLVIAGLFTVFIKIRFTKSAYYLMRVNAWYVVALLVAGSFVQWDPFIAEYNIVHRKRTPLDLPYLLTMSHQVLPVLHQHLPELRDREKELNAAGIWLERGNASIDQILNGRISLFKEEQRQYSWLSWNYADAQALAYFNHQPTLATIKNQ